MPSRYALVAYINSPVEQFVQKLRRELHPGLPHLAAHITLLPPRALCGSENDALQLLARVCSRAEPFEIILGDMQTFIPSTPTVYIRVTSGAARLQELHDQLNREHLWCSEEWAYVPHLTIAKMESRQSAEEALNLSRHRWQEYAGPRRILVDRLTFVREQQPNQWVDLAPVPLGGSLVSP